jgi:hypothetical protein
MLAGKCLEAESQWNYRTHLGTFSFIKNYNPVIPVIQSLKTITSIILFGFVVVSGRDAKWCNSY